MGWAKRERKAARRSSARAYRTEPPPSPPQASEAARHVEALHDRDGPGVVWFERYADGKPIDRQRILACNAGWFARDIAGQSDWYVSLNQFRPSRHSRRDNE